MTQNKTKFVIAGGGTAGWIAALYLKKYFPQNSITVIESTEIGILGAGEGTTPHFINFLNEVQIDIPDFIKNTKATFKSGIKFTNWHGDNEYYFHPFDARKYDFYYEKNVIVANDYISNNKKIEDICIFDHCSRQNKIQFFFENKTFQPLGSYALHFDARLTAQYLKQIAVSRGVIHIDSKIVSSMHNPANFHVESLVLENDKAVECDFVFDCTGFARKIIGGVFKEEWIDYKNSLPVDRALPFFIENKTEVIPPYTEAIAMKYGWIWKIPVQGRYGCGYVFDSSYASDEEIKKEVTELFGEVEFPRSFSFKAGFHKNIWVKNCLSLGLAAGFIEPLEATSIWTTIRSMQELLENFKKTILTKNENEIASYNKRMRQFNEEVKDFIQLHYMTKRNDSSFWKEYKTKNLISEKVLEYYQVKDFQEYMKVGRKNFVGFNPVYVSYGVKICDTQSFKTKFIETIKQPEHFGYEDYLKQLKYDVETFANFQAIDHFKFLEYIKNTL